MAQKGDVSTIATPQSAALLLQVLTSYTLASRESTLDDVTPAMDAAAVLQAMLPILLAPGSGGEETVENLKAIAEVSSLLRSFTDSLTVPASKDVIAEIVESLRASSGLQRPMLVKATDLWRQQREKDGILRSFFDEQEGVEVGTEGPLAFLPCNTDGGCIVL